MKNYSLDTLIALMINVDHEVIASAENDALAVFIHECRRLENMAIQESMHRTDLMPPTPIDRRSRFS